MRLPRRYAKSVHPEKSEEAWIRVRDVSLRMKKGKEERKDPLAP
jgi:hypothetical protein